VLNLEAKEKNNFFPAKLAFVGINLIECFLKKTDLFRMNSGLCGISGSIDTMTY